jgi:hypothetical protein
LTVHGIWHTILEQNFKEIQSNRCGVCSQNMPGEINGLKNKQKMEIYPSV